MASDFPGNVVSFFRDDLAGPDASGQGFLDALEAPLSRDAGILSQADVSAIGDGAERVAGALARMALAPDDAGTLGFALDGLIAAERSPQQGDIITDILTQLAGEPGDPALGLPPFVLPDQLVIRQPDAGSGTGDLGFDSAFVPPTDGWPAGVVLLSENLGFRETQLALQDQVSTAFAVYAEDAGLDLAPGDAGIRVARALRGEPDALGGLDTQLSQIELALGDATLTALTRSEGG